MKMTFRWYGKEIDPIQLKYVKQIPGMSGLMGLLDKPAGVDWPEEEVKELVPEAGPGPWGGRLRFGTRRGEPAGDRRQPCRSSESHGASG